MSATQIPFLQGYNKFSKENKMKAKGQTFEATVFIRVTISPTV